MKLLVSGKINRFIATPTVFSCLQNCLRPLTLAALLVLIIGGCGGGSAGTGLGTPIEGRVLLNGSGVANATVTILETGDSTTTDTQGNFSILPSEALATATLLIESGTMSKTVQVGPGSTGSIVNIEIENNGPPPPLPQMPLDLKVKIVGRCDPYFENKKIIRQSSAAPQGVLCTAKASVSSNAKPIGGVRFAVQHRNCESNSAWKTDAVSETSEVYFPGTGQVQFRFFNDKEHCHFRVTAPYLQKYKVVQEVLIEPFSAQK